MILLKKIRKSFVFLSLRIPGEARIVETTGDKLFLSFQILSFPRKQESIKVGIIPLNIKRDEKYENFLPCTECI